MNIRKIIQSARSWKDLNKILENYTKSNRSKLAGDVFENLSKLYLQTAPQYKSKLKKVYLEKEVPSSLRKKLNNKKGDLYFRQGWIAKTPIGKFNSYLSEESYLIGKFQPKMNRSKHR